MTASADQWLVVGQSRQPRLKGTLAAMGVKPDKSNWPDLLIGSYS